MRADVNISVREVGMKTLGTRTEMKNLNSFKAIRRAIEKEKERQIALIEAGESVIQETRRWDDTKECSYTMRSKEDAKDYRYFPEPDLLPLVIDENWIAKIKEEQPEFRTEKMKRYKEQFDLPDYDIGILTESKYLADFFEECERECHLPKKVSNWIMGETMRLLKEQELEPEELRLSPQNLAKLILLVEKKEINITTAKEVFEVMFRENVDPIHYVEEQGLKTVSDDGFLKNVIEEVLTEHPQSVEDYKNGKKKAIGFLVGQTMKRMKGTADPGVVNRILTEVLET